MRAQGYDAQLGTWLVTGRPPHGAINPFQAYPQLRRPAQTDLWDPPRHSGLDTDDCCTRLLLSATTTIFFQHRRSR
jgi:glycogen(starch) synthase